MDKYGNLLNTIALLNWARVCSTDGKTCLSHLTHLFRCDVYADTDFLVWFWNHNHTWAPVCGIFHLENYLLVFHPSFYLIHQWQWNCLGVDRANRVASLLSLMSYSPWSFPSPESSWGNLVKTVSLLMVMPQIFATRFSAFMTGKPTNGWWRSFTAKIFPWLCHCFTPFALEYPKIVHKYSASLYLVPTVFNVTPSLWLWMVLLWLQEWLWDLRTRIFHWSTALLAILLCDYLLNVLYLEMHFLILLVYHLLLSRLLS